MTEKQEKYHKSLIGKKRKPHSLETKEKMRLSRIKRKEKFGYLNSPETRKKLGDIRRGMKLPEEWRKKLAGNNKGENHYNWKGGVSPKHQIIRHSLEYRLWRESVFKRDNYTCIWCGDNKGGNLNADHIKPFAYYPELRFAIDNGRTLCRPCHLTTDTYGNKKR